MPVSSRLFVAFALVSLAACSARSSSNATDGAVPETTPTPANGSGGPFDNGTPSPGEGDVDPVDMDAEAPDADMDAAVDVDASLDGGADAGDAAAPECPNGSLEKEPNDNAELANPVAAGTYCGVVGGAGDAVDFLKLPLKAGQTYRFAYEQSAPLRVVRTELEGVVFFEIRPRSNRTAQYRITFTVQ